MTERPSDVLRRSKVSWKAVAAATASAVVLAVGGIGAYALSTTTSNSVQVAESPTVTPTPEPTVEEVNLAPTAYYVVAVVDGLTLTFDGTGSTDADGAIAEYVWDFGDGTTGAGDTTSHSYGSGGSYTVVLSVTDGGGEVGTFSAVIDVVAPAAPSSGGGVGCPSGAIIAESIDGVVTYCLWEYCTHLTLPDPGYPECVPFRP